MVLRQIFLLSILSMQNLEVQSEGSKERFDAILARFGFSGIPAENKKVTDNGAAFVRATPPRVITNVEREGKNVIPDERRKQVKHGYYTFIVKRKMQKKKKLGKVPVGGPFTINPGTGVKVPNPQLLNERIINPVFKSRYPGRKNIRK